MTKIDWAYLRKNCVTCERAEAFLDKSKIAPEERVDARKEPLEADDALKFVRKVATEIYATKGKKVVHVDMKKDKPTDDDLRKLVIGPSGRLRAPALRLGKTLVIGFESELFKQQFGK